MLTRTRISNVFLCIGKHSYSSPSLNVFRNTTPNRTFRLCLCLPSGTQPHKCDTTANAVGSGAAPQCPPTINACLASEITNWMVFNSCFLRLAEPNLRGSQQRKPPRHMFPHCYAHQKHNITRCHAFGNILSPKRSFR